MESAVSAFAVYKAKTKSNHSKKQLKKQKVKVNKNLANKPENLSEHTMKKAAKKLKQKHEKKPKDNIKKKIHKKKKKNKKHHSLNNNARPNNQSDNSNNPVAVPDENSELQIEDDIQDIINDEIPLLVPVVEVTGFSENESDDSASDLPFKPVTTNSITEGLRAFSWMLAPFNAKKFFIDIWEMKPLHIKRNKPNYYQDIMSTPYIDKMLRTQNVQFNKNIDVTTYTDQKRETHNLEGRAHPHVIWDFYLNGCSIRIINPQSFTPKLHALNSTLQEFFHCFVGANAYLTPPDSQGFAPHYDDIEAFILQVEGKKLWKVYAPRSEDETLPRFSSRNFEQTEIGEPILEVLLEAGDMLYFPRGYIHQAVCIEGQHSLHITVSMYQKNAWADLLEKLIPEALQEAINHSVDIRKGLPFDIYDNFGYVNTDIKTPRKTALIEFIKKFVDDIKSHLNIDNAVDELAKLYQHAVLPPVLTDLEKQVTVYGDHALMVANGKIVNRVEMGLDTRIRLLRKNILRMVSEDGIIKIFHCAENSVEYHGNELQFLEIPEPFVPAVETLISAYPLYIFVENLNVKSGAEGDKLQLACDFWEKGLIMTEFPLDIVDDD